MPTKILPWLPLVSLSTCTLILQEASAHLDVCFNPMRLSSLRREFCVRMDMNYADNSTLCSLER